MRRIKGRSTNKLFEAFPELKKRYWRGGYFCVTVGTVTKEMIEKYIEYHFEPKIDDSFQVD